MTKTLNATLGARTFKYELGAFLRTCEAVDTPRSLACYLMAKAGEWQQYLDLEFPDLDSQTFADDYLVTEMLRKAPNLPGLKIDRKAASKKVWFDAEAQCTATNDLLESYSRGEISFSPVIETILTKTIGLISTILNHDLRKEDYGLSRYKLDYMERHFRFGPGATSSCSGSKVVLSRKMVSCFDMTPGLQPYWRSLLSGTWGSHVNDFSIVKHNKVTFVPKTAKIDRAIAIEPHGNIFVQLGIGALLRRQLRLAGLDLDTQADVNRAYAARAQKEGFATIDLSSASDTISSELVRMLLPPDWYELLDLARCKFSLIDGVEVPIQKFSSMGNGYTFELETLIFYCFAKAVSDVVQVFGDDIIVRSEHAVELIETLKLFGFKVNERKTFLAGRFFESCGSDYYDSVNIRPFYLKGKYEDEDTAVIRICNKIRLYAHRRNHGFGCDIRLLGSWLFILTKSKIAMKTCVPLDHGNDGLIRNLDEAQPSVKVKRRNWRTIYCASVFYHKPLRSRETVTVGAYLASLHQGTADLCSRMIENIRGRVGRGSLRVSYVYDEWTQPGPWC